MVSRLLRDEIPRLVLDANIMVSALLGASFGFLLLLFEGGVHMMAPVQQLAEVRKTLGSRNLDDAAIEARMEELQSVVEPLHPDIFTKHEEWARLRLDERGQPDWPVLAASLATEASVWSHDKDFFGSGAPVWSTFMLHRQVKNSTVTPR